MARTKAAVQEEQDTTVVPQAQTEDPTDEVEEEVDKNDEGSDEESDKEKAANPVVPPPTEKEEPKSEPKVMPGPKKLWISQSPKVEVTAYLYINDESGNIEAVLQNALDPEEKEKTKVSEYPLKATFSIPKRRQMQRYRERSGRWIADAQSLITDRFLMRQQILRYHLEAIDLTDPTTGKPVLLKHEKDGKLTAESEALLDDLHPTILEVLMSKFERLADLVL